MNLSRSLPLTFSLSFLACGREPPAATAQSSCAAYYDILSAKAITCANGLSGYDTKPAFLRQCQSALALPGSKADAVWLQACAAAYRTSENICSETDAGMQTTYRQFGWRRALF
jgi:hypothetical protein